MIRQIVRIIPKVQHRVARESSIVAAANRDKGGYFALFSAGLLSISVALCEEEKPVDSVNELGSRNEEPRPMKDPEKYENLPDEDVETDCFLCKTHRQGPCRDVWRNFEYCVKDNQDDSSVCDRFVKPFERCWMEHIQLYLLIALDTNANDVNRIREKLQFAGATSFDPVIDWSQWLDFIDTELWRKAKATSGLWQSVDKGLAYWKRFEFLKVEPSVVNVASFIPVNDHGGLKLKVVYAVDQAGVLLGYADYDEAYEAKKAEDQGHALPTEHKFMISIVPGMTEGIRVATIYEQSPKGELRAFESNLLPVPVDKPTQT